MHIVTFLKKCKDIKIVLLLQVIPTLTNHSGIVFVYTYIWKNKLYIYMYIYIYKYVLICVYIYWDSIWQSF